MWKEFKAFLIKQNALALAIAVVIGAALNDVVKAIVDGFIMPIVAAVSPSPESWQQATVDLGRLHFRVGLILGAILNFFIIGFVAWRLSRVFLRPAPPGEKPTTKPCPYCRMADLDPAATRCPHCTSELPGTPAYSPAAGGTPTRA